MSKKPAAAPPAPAPTSLVAMAHWPNDKPRATWEEGVPQIFEALLFSDGSMGIHPGDPMDDLRAEARRCDDRETDPEQFTRIVRAEIRILETISIPMAEPIETKPGAARAAQPVPAPKPPSSWAVATVIAGQVQADGKTMVSLIWPFSEPAALNGRIRINPTAKD